MDTNYSIIIPHKNCPELLQRCVDSIPIRDDVQIIVIDDNSDEGKKPSVKRDDTEIILLDANHAKGAGRARNIGLKQAKGKWLMFADADDYYTSYLSQLLDKYADDETNDIVYLNACVFDEESNRKPHHINSLIEDFIIGSKKAEDNLRYKVWTPWSRMVKKQLVVNNSINYDEIPAGNDVMFCLKCSKFALHIVAEEQFVYCYYRPKNGSQTDKLRKTMLESRFVLRGQIYQLYKEVGFKPLPSFLDIVLFSIKNRIEPFNKVITLYVNQLRSCNVNLLTDIVRYLF